MEICDAVTKRLWEDLDHGESLVSAAGWLAGEPGDGDTSRLSFGASGARRRRDLRQLHLEEQRRAARDDRLHHS